MISGWISSEIILKLSKSVYTYLVLKNTQNRNKPITLIPIAFACKPVGLNFILQPLGKQPSFWFSANPSILLERLELCLTNSNCCRFSTLSKLPWDHFTCCWAKRIFKNFQRRGLPATSWSHIKISPHSKLKWSHHDSYGWWEFDEKQKIWVFTFKVRKIQPEFFGW